MSPLIAGQALWVRRRALQLSEPAGARQGRAGQGPGLRLLVLGDSSAAGVGALHQDEALIGPLVRTLSDGFDLDWQLCARCGATTASTHRLLDALEPRRFDVAFLSLGVNDAKNGVSLRAFERRYVGLIDRLCDTHGVRHVFVSGLPPIRHFPLLPWPLNDVLGDRAARFDACLTALTDARDACTFLPLDVPLDPAGMAEDGFHPGPAIYAEWAGGIAAAIRAGLTPP